MYRQEKQSQAPTLFDSIDENDSKSSSLEPKTIEKNQVPLNINQQKPPFIPEIPNQNNEISRQDFKMPSNSSDKSVRKIIVYYNDNTFQEFETK
jgi:hypothetical protein